VESSRSSLFLHIPVWNRVRFDAGALIHNATAPHQSGMSALDFCRLLENSAAYPGNVLFPAVTCPSFRLEYRSLLRLARGIIGQLLPFPGNQRRATMPAWSNNSCGLLIVGFDQSAKAFPASNGCVTRILLRLLSNSSVPRQHTRCEAPWRCCSQITVSVTE